MGVVDIGDNFVADTSTGERRLRSPGNFKAASLTVVAQWHPFRRKLPHYKLSVVSLTVKKNL
jgi:hypothetical protein